MKYIYEIINEEENYRTASILMNVANTIEKDIQYTIDVPSK